MQAEKASGPPEELAWPGACPPACEGGLELELEQAVVIPATTAAATMSAAIRRAPGARHGRGGRVRVGMGLRIWNFLLACGAALKEYGQPGYATETQPVTLL
jgi:hypothetical protein